LRRADLAIPVRKPRFAKRVMSQIGKLVNENGAPEEIRTPDPQIRSLILSNSLTFPDFPER